MKLLDKIYLYVIIPLGAIAGTTAIIYFAAVVTTPLTI